MYNEIISTLEEKLQKTIGVFKSEINTVRAGRANPALLDGIKINYYQGPSEIKGWPNRRLFRRRPPSETQSSTLQGSAFLNCR